MTKTFTILFFSLFTFCLQAQQKEFWLIDSGLKTKKVLYDSLQAVKFMDSLVENGYFFANLKKVSKEGFITTIEYDKGVNYNSGFILVSDTLSKDLNLKNEFFSKNIDSLKRKINQYYRDKGFAFNRIKSTYKGLKDDYPIVNISLLPEQKRIINGFTIKGYEKAPKRFMKNLTKEFAGKVYNPANIRKISKNLKNHPFVSEDRAPQTLFTRDSTNVFLYLNKRKSNAFDGIIGFGNSKTEKFQLNGSLNVSLQNMFNGFEKIQIYWQRNPDSGQTFDLNVDVPYLFDSNVGFNANVNIFRQDSLFANVKLQPSVYYNFSMRQKAGIRGIIEESSVLAESYNNGQDYSKKGVGFWYNYAVPSDVDLFINQTKFVVSGDILKANYEKDNISATQTSYYILAENNFHLVGNNYINIKGEISGINSKVNFIENELLRFGGWNSLRGFNENSLIGNFYAYIGAEYRYVIGDQAFFDLFTQVGRLENSFSNLGTNLYSFGTGFNYKLAFGIMSFQISSGNNFGTPFRFQDTKVQWGLVTKF